MHVPGRSGSWRKARAVTRYTDTLFTDILVPLSGDSKGWGALEQAMIIARREGARIHGLHVVDSKQKVESEHSLAIQASFDQRCKAANVDGTLLIESGEITRRICERAAITDLIVLEIAHPPAGGLSTLKSAYRSIITNSSVPVLAVPETATHFQRALLAYDGSLRAKEALFVATYLAEIWKTQLTVFSALEGGKPNNELHDYVRRYLELHEVNADYVIEQADAKQVLKRKVEEYHADLVLMGGYGNSAIRDLVVGSLVDFVLRECKVPTLVCR